MIISFPQIVYDKWDELFPVDINLLNFIYSTNNFSDEEKLDHLHNNFFSIYNEFKYYKRSEAPFFAFYDFLNQNNIPLLDTVGDYLFNDKIDLNYYHINLYLELLKQDNKSLSPSQFDCYFDKIITHSKLLKDSNDNEFMSVVLSSIINIAKFSYHHNDTVNFVLNLAEYCYDPDHPFHLNTQIAIENYLSDNNLDNDFCHLYPYLDNGNYMTDISLQQKILIIDLNKFKFQHHLSLECEEISQGLRFLNTALSDIKTYSNIQPKINIANMKYVTTGNSGQFEISSYDEKDLLFIQSLCNLVIPIMFHQPQEINADFNFKHLIESALLQQKLLSTLPINTNQKINKKKI